MRERNNKKKKKREGKLQGNCSKRVGEGVEKWEREGEKEEREEKLP